MPVVSLSVYLSMFTVYSLYSFTVQFRDVGSVTTVGSVYGCTGLYVRCLFVVCLFSGTAYGCRRLLSVVVGWLFVGVGVGRDG